ncbi:MAG: outer membrane lipoprotein chaperone LolA [Xanthomonadaceae bacterium]|nr:outer membrane lipoprotein chaperone LolA [Xanthomonadaceae bacterium]
MARTRITLVLTGLLAAIAGPVGYAADLEAGRERVESYLNGLQGLQAEFQQVLTDRSGRAIDEASGVLAISRPNRFRWDYREPYEQVIVADGSRIWLYDTDLEQVTVRKLDDTLSATPAMLLSGEANLDENFTVTGVEDDATVQWVEMEPKRSDTDFRSVRLGFEGTTLKHMQLADKLGQTTRLTFTNVEHNPVLDPSRFTFTVPPGVDVIGDPAQSASAPTP